MGTLVETWIVARVSAIDAVADIIGKRIYPVRVPQRRADVTEYQPAITYRRAATNALQHMTGADGPVTVRLELRCWSTDYSQTRAMAKSLAENLDSLSGDEMGLEIQRTHVTNIYDDEQAPYLSDDITVYAAVVALDVVHSETNERD